MPSWKALLVSAAFAGEAFAQEFPVPDLSGDVVCDGTIRPDYNECREELLPQTFDGVTVGPGFMEGPSFKGDDCQIRILKCGQGTAGEFPVDNVASYFGIAENECGEFSAGAVYRWGDACIYVDTPDNSFGPNSKRSEPEREKKQARRDLVNEAREPEDRQCNPPPGPCYTYTEQTFITGVRGFAERVCDNILPDGAKCDQTKSVTVTETFSFDGEVTAGLKDVVSVGASFSSSVAEAVTETITTSIQVDCPNGGYIVYYPLMEVSRGECGVGPQETCNGDCITDSTEPCEYRKPIESGDGNLSGEYDIQCV
ncbi:hypothetical protein DL764_003943 [Monosporascus ibericus]|uniref:Ubiquitin 3 binding protein But2 C-terminal domain-containing protein n=1 Tax=Monosporascus ibericus TaxID=155417 RepID=A0A4Q4TEL0_9PEZI|nr:hypothetical protein DL764_003943 [Monosporascus ibericus]